MYSRFTNLQILITWRCRTRSQVSLFIYYNVASTSRLSLILLRVILLLAMTNYNSEGNLAKELAIRLLVNSYDIDFPILSLECFRGTEEAFLALRNQTDTDYLDAPFKIRARVATQLARSSEVNGPRIFRLALQPGPLLPTDIQEESSQLLPAVAEAIGQVVRSINSGQPSCSQRDLVRDLTGM